MRRRNLFRASSVLWAVLQFALPAALSVGDAYLERESARGPRAHVENNSGTACRPVHATDCALCQFVSHAAGLKQDAGGLSLHADVSPATPSAAHGRASAVMARLSLARAPPLG